MKCVTFVDLNAVMFEKRIDVGGLSALAAFVQGE